MDFQGNKKEFDKSATVGVYALYREGKIVYVGASRNALYRIQTHEVASPKLFDSYEIIHCTEDQLLETEERLILKYAPEYNKAINTAINAKLISDFDGCPNMVINANLTVLNGRVYIDLSAINREVNKILPDTVVTVYQSPSKIRAKEKNNVKKGVQND